MDTYLFKNKFYIQDPSMLYSKLVLLFEPDPELSAIYHRHLRGAAMAVVRAPSHEELPSMVQTYEPDLLICSLDPDPNRVVKMLRYVKHYAPSVLIVTLGSGAIEFSAAALLELGVSAHINRSLTRPVDVALAAHDLLHYSRP
jgi:DNA-binding response OmpR family regulator